MKVLRAIFAGVMAALSMSLAMFLMRSFGLNISLEAVLGSLFDPRPDMSPWTMGFIAHLAIGGVVALVYAFFFEVALQGSGPFVGGGVGLSHALLAGLFMSAIPAMNPLDPHTAWAPGPFLSNVQYGLVLFFFLHFLYGMVVGLVYGRPLQKPHVHPTRAASAGH